MRDEITDMGDILTSAVTRVRRQSARVRRARRRRRQVRGYLAEHPEPKLQLGSGHHLVGGWLNTDRDPSSDAVHLDVAKRFPFPDRTFAYVFNEHLIEHLPYATGVEMLREVHRVLRPGGRIRTATPDLRVIVGLLEPRPDATATRYAHWLADSYFPGRQGDAAVFAVNQVFHGWGHTFLYDEATLRATLESVGFVEVCRQPFGASDDPVLDGLEGHGVPDDNTALSAFETMVIEAVRP